MISNYLVQFFREKVFKFFTRFQLMHLGWKSFLPLSLGLLIFMSGLLFYFDGLPYDLSIFFSI